MGLSQQLFAQDNYQQWVFDITNRLNNTEQLIKENKIDDAKTEVQMAYFEVFENLEGPIRINFSAQKSYQMEATFGEIRKMIGEGKPMSEIQAKIEGLKKELQEVLPSLIEGHQLNADGQHGVYDNAEIIFLTQKKLFNKPNTMATKILKWKCRYEPIVRLKFHLPSINNSTI